MTLSDWYSKQESSSCNFLYWKRFYFSNIRGVFTDSASYLFLLFLSIIKRAPSSVVAFCTPMELQGDDNFFFEDKQKVLSRFSDSDFFTIPSFSVLRFVDLDFNLDEKNFSFPVIAKPLSSMQGIGAYVIYDQKGLNYFLEQRQGDYIIQNFLQGKYEIGVFTRRRQERLVCESTVLKYQLPERDKEKSLNDLEADFLFLDITKEVSAGFTEEIEKQLEMFSEVSFGRLDLLVDSLDFSKPQKVYLIEYNIGAASTDLRSLACNIPFWKAPFYELRKWHEAFLLGRTLWIQGGKKRLPKRDNFSGTLRALFSLKKTDQIKNQ